MPESKTPIGRSSIPAIVRPVPAPFLRLVFAAVARRLLLVVVLLALLAGRASAAGFATDQLVTMDDGAQIATTLYLPTGTPPADGWPAIMMFHGLGGKRQDLAPLATGYFVPAGFAVLTLDARGHGESGGLFDGDGPRTIADTRFLFDWLAARPDVSDTKIGGWGVSYGGGNAWRSTVDGVPFAAIETVETWTDLYRAFIPQNLSKSGAAFGFLSSVPTARTDPSVLAIRDAALTSTDLPLLLQFSNDRSSITALDRITTPTLIFQGRRDFVFGLEQGLAAFTRLRGPHRIYIGDFGHSPSTFPGPDIAPLMTEATEWYARFLQGVPNGIDTRAPVELMPDPYRETPAVGYKGLPPTRTAAFSFSGSKTIAAGGKVVRSVQVPAKLETFGAGVVTIPINATRGWPQVVAVLSEKSRSGDETVVGEGGVRLEPGAKTIQVKLNADATLIPRGSRLVLTLATGSTAQSPGNLLFLDTVVPLGAKLTVGTVKLQLPVLKKPISG